MLKALGAGQGVGVPVGHFRPRGCLEPARPSPGPSVEEGPECGLFLWPPGEAGSGGWDTCVAAPAGEGTSLLRVLVGSPGSLLRGTGPLADLVLSGGSEPAQAPADPFPNALASVSPGARGRGVPRRARRAGGGGLPAGRYLAARLLGQQRGGGLACSSRHLAGGRGSAALRGSKSRWSPSLQGPVQPCAPSAPDPRSGVNSKASRVGSCRRGRVWPELHTQLTTSPSSSCASPLAHVACGAHTRAHAHTPTCTCMHTASLPFACLSHSPFLLFFWGGTRD